MVECFMADGAPRYEIPAELTAARDELEDRFLRAVGRAVARVVATISKEGEQDTAAAYLAAMQDALSGVRRDDARIVDSVIQRAYLAGRTAGTEDVGRQLGMLPKGPPATPEVTH